MSWIVEDLIINSSVIRSNRHENLSDYFSLLTLENKILELHKKGILKEDELNFIISVSNIISLAEVADLLSIHRNTARTKFKNICNKLAFYLGNYYTDFGYVKYLTKEYKLNNEEENKLMRFMVEK